MATPQSQRGICYYLVFFKKPDSLPLEGQRCFLLVMAYRRVGCILNLASDGGELRSSQVDESQEDLTSQLVRVKVLCCISFG